MSAKKPAESQSRSLLRQCIDYQQS